MEKRTIRSGAPFLTAGLAVLLAALVLGLGSVFSYVIALAAGAAGFFFMAAVRKTAFPQITFYIRESIAKSFRYIPHTQFPHTGGINNHHTAF